MSTLPELSGVAGAAFRLRQPASLSLEFEHPEARLLIREGSALVVAILQSLPPNSSIREASWRVTQESLDILAARRSTVLATSKGDTEYLFWSKAQSGYELTCVSTVETTWSMQATGVVGGPNATLPPSPPPVTHHLAMRFYRMSQCASDLYEAYRNAYLALECLISDVSAKRSGEAELKWLKRVVTGPLAAGVPPGLEPLQTLEQIYENGRNPLFHAKVGETFYPPNASQRELVQELFEQLTLLLVCLLQHRLGNHPVRRWGALSRAIQADEARLILGVDELRFQDAEKTSVTPIVDIVDSPRRFRLPWARLSVKKPEALVSMQNVDFLREGKSHMHMTMEESVPTVNLSSLVFEVNVINRNYYAPKGAYPE